ncbi:hypothetical protein NIF40_11925 [[Clostridium] leptum]|nr:hypothetical protein [[Clostridium] leptum]
MENPKKDNPEKGAKSYKSLWITECIFWCLIPFYFYMRWIMSDPDWIHGRAFGFICIFYAFFIVGIMGLGTWGIITDYKGLVRRGKTEHKPWKLASLLITRIFYLLISSYILFIYH